MPKVVSAKVRSCVDLQDAEDVDEQRDEEAEYGGVSEQW